MSRRHRAHGHRLCDRDERRSGIARACCIHAAEIAVEFQRDAAKRASQQHRLSRRHSYRIRFTIPARQTLTSIKFAIPSSQTATVKAGDGASRFATITRNPAIPKASREPVSGYVASRLLFFVFSRNGLGKGLGAGPKVVRIADPSIDFE